MIDEDTIAERLNTRMRTILGLAPGNTHWGDCPANSYFGNPSFCNCDQKARPTIIRGSEVFTPDAVRVRINWS